MIPGKPLRLLSVPRQDLVSVPQGPFLLSPIAMRLFRPPGGRALSPSPEMGSLITFQKSRMGSTSPLWTPLPRCRLRGEVKYSDTATTVY